MFWATFLVTWGGNYGVRNIKIALFESSNGAFWVATVNRLLHTIWFTSQFSFSWQLAVWQSSFLPIRLKMCPILLCTYKYTFYILIWVLTCKFRSEPVPCDKSLETPDPFVTWACVRWSRHRTNSGYIPIYLVYFPITFPIDLHDKYFPIFDSSYFIACRISRVCAANSIWVWYVAREIRLHTRAIFSRIAFSLIK